MTAATAIRQGIEQLSGDGIPEPRLTAEVLLAHALGRERAWLYGHPEQELTGIEQLHYGRYLYERLRRKPTQYITGRQEFYGREFRVTPAVLIPRPETELMVETALRLAPRARRVLDVGTGSGCLAVTLARELPGAVVWASEISDQALAVAKQNAARLGAAVRFFRGDLLGAVRGGALDLVASNPPYIAEEEAGDLAAEVRHYEPAVALLGGPLGVDFYRRLLRDAPSALRPGGWLMLELGHDTRPRIEPWIGSGWSDCIVEPDLAGIDRVLALRRCGTMPA